MTATRSEVEREQNRAAMRPILARFDEEMQRNIRELRERCPNIDQMLKDRRAALETAGRWTPADDKFLSLVERDADEARIEMLVERRLAEIRARRPGKLVVTHADGSQSFLEFDESRQQLTIKHSDGGISLMEPAPAHSAETHSIDDRLLKAVMRMPRSLLSHPSAANDFICERCPELAANINNDPIGFRACLDALRDELATPAGRANIDAWLLKNPH